MTRNSKETTPYPTDGYDYVWSDEAADYDTIYKKVTPQGITNSFTLTGAWVLTAESAQKILDKRSLVKNN